ncbi:MAG: hemin uptake protein HemP [Thiotrichales bacterium]
MSFNDTHSSPGAAAPPPQDPDQTSDDDGKLPARAYTTDQLFGSHAEIVIDHLGQTYRLRITRQNKLILTK